MLTSSWRHKSGPTRCLVWNVRVSIGFRCYSLKCTCSADNDRSCDAESLCIHINDWLQPGPCCPRSPLLSCTEEQGLTQFCHCPQQAFEPPAPLGCFQAEGLSNRAAGVEAGGICNRGIGGPSAWILCSCCPKASFHTPSLALCRPSGLLPCLVQGQPPARAMQFPVALTTPQGPE